MRGDGELCEGCEGCEGVCKRAGRRGAEAVRVGACEGEAWD